IIGASGGPFLPQPMASTTAGTTQRRRRRNNRTILTPVGSSESLLDRRLLGLGGRAALRHDAPAGCRRPESAHVHAEVADLVVENPLGGVEQARRLRAIPARRLERILDQIAL